MTHKELMFSLKETLIKMCHLTAYLHEDIYMMEKSYKQNGVKKRTPTSKAIYVVTLDRCLAKRLSK